MRNPTALIGSATAPAHELESSRPERPDVRGWRVFSGDAEFVGLVERLVLDASATIRYLVVDLPADAGGSPNAGGPVLIPVGAARRLDDCDAIVLDVLSLAQLRAAPRIDHRGIRAALEDETLAAYGMLTPAELPGGPYSGALFDERRLFRSTRRPLQGLISARERLS
jgi:hypothetical protein